MIRRLRYRITTLLLVVQGMCAASWAAGQERVRVRVTGSFEVALAASDAFHLFEPEGERRWAREWDPLYPSGLPESPARGTVFRTEGEHETIWQVVDHEPAAGRVSYSYVTPGRRVALIDVEVTATSPAGSRVKVTYTVTSLAEEEDDDVREFEAGYDDFLRHWAHAIEEHVVNDPPMQWESRNRRARRRIPTPSSSGSTPTADSCGIAPRSRGRGQPLGALAARGRWRAGRGSHRERRGARLRRLADRGRRPQNAEGGF